MSNMLANSTQPKDNTDLIKPSLTLSPLFTIIVVLSVCGSRTAHLRFRFNSVGTCTYTRVHGKEYREHPQGSRSTA